MSTDSTNGNDLERNSSGKEDMISSRPVPAKPKKKEPVEMVTIMFKENRKFDLHVGRNMITFRGRVEKKIPASYLEHSDFKQAASLFIIKGVK